MDQGFQVHSDEIHHIETADTISPVSGRVDLHVEHVTPTDGCWSSDAMLLWMKWMMKLFSTHCSERWSASQPSVQHCHFVWESLLHQLSIDQPFPLMTTTWRTIMPWDQAWVDILSNHFLWWAQGTTTTVFNQMRITLDCLIFNAVSRFINQITTLSVLFCIQTPTLQQSRLFSLDCCNLLAVSLWFPAQIKLISLIDTHSVIQLRYAVWIAAASDRYMFSNITLWLNQRSTAARVYVLVIIPSHVCLGVYHCSQKNLSLRHGSCPLQLVFQAALTPLLLLV